jgi:8-oxo-dGTP diphosphatase
LNTSSFIQPKKKKIEVVAAIIMCGHHILCTQRGENKYDYISRKFEFPGGKIEKGETDKEALKRELIEELSMTPEIGNHFLTIHHEYPDFELTMHCYLCSAESKTLTLNEHKSCQWLLKSELKNLDWAEADIPIIQKLGS